MSDPIRTEWVWIERFAAQFRLCGLHEGETAVLLSETRSRPELVETARLALGSLGVAMAQIIMPTPANPGPVPIRSTGASVALAQHQPALAALAAADFVVDCTVEGLLHAPELGSILSAGTRILMISNEHPEHFERLAHDDAMGDRVALGARWLNEAHTMRVTSDAGTELEIRLDGAMRAGSRGVTAGPGDIAHWPGGLVLAFPAAHSVNGTIVLAPGDLNLTFKEYVRSPIRLTIRDDYITAIEPVDPTNPFDADLFSSYLGAFEESDAYATSHVGWGMNPAARWDAIPLFDKSQTNGTEARAFAGNFLYSTGANETAGRFTRGHFDLPMRHCTIVLERPSDAATADAIDSKPMVTVVDHGRLHPALAPPSPH